MIRDEGVQGEEQLKCDLRCVCRQAAPRIAAGLARLVHLQLRVLEKTEFEKRLAKEERLLRESMAGKLKGVRSQIRRT